MPESGCPFAPEDAGADGVAEGDAGGGGLLLVVVALVPRLEKDSTHRKAGWDSMARRLFTI